MNKTPDMTNEDETVAPLSASISRFQYIVMAICFGFLASTALAFGGNETAKEIAWILGIVSVLASFILTKKTRERDALKAKSGA